MRQLQAYFTMRHELTVKVGLLDCVESKLVMRGDQVLIPSALLDSNYLRKFIKVMRAQRKCAVCCRPMLFGRVARGTLLLLSKDAQLVQCIRSNRTRRRWFHIAEKVETPYEVVSVDLTGPSATLHGQVLLTTIDYYSRYPEVYILKYGDTKEILTCLRHVFARNGIPATLVSDNGSVFWSVEFGEFLCFIGTKHVLASNYHPMSNGTVDECMVL